jgi:hypothetical protein
MLSLIEWHSLNVLSNFDHCSVETPSYGGNTVHTGAHDFYFLSIKAPPYEGDLAKNPPQVWESSGPGGIRTLDLLSAKEIMVGEKGKKSRLLRLLLPKSPYNSLHTLHSFLAYQYPNCSRCMKQ